MRRKLERFISLLSAVLLVFSMLSMEVKADEYDAVTLKQLDDTVNAMSSKTAKNFKKFYEKVEKLDQEIEDGTCNQTSIQFKKGVAQEAISYSGKRYTYYGETKNGYPNGFGKVIIDSDYAYYATFSSGKVSGYAMSVNYSYEGIEGWAGDSCSIKGGSSGELLISGKGLVFAHVNDDYYDENVAGNNYLAYEGKLKDSKKDGSGTSYYANGNIYYEGEYKKSDFSGKGKLYYYDGTLQYEGSFKYGKYNGKGILYNEDGSIKHKGKFKNGNIS